MNRRGFLTSIAAGVGAGLMPNPAVHSPRLHGEWLSPAFSTGHRLRGSDWPAPSEERRTGILIVGGGIAGLSAGWWLRRRGFADFRLLELEGETGGNSRSGANRISAYPWGAHYLPLPGPELVWVRTLLAELGVIIGDPAAENPRYDERYLCFAPQERLFLQGAWQEGLVPRRGIDRREQEQFPRFFGLMDEFRAARGRDGRRAFALPMAASSADGKFRSLDKGSMADFLRERGFDSPALHWYVNYACRDDFGCDYRQTSAWAGLHYFASRTGRGDEAREGAVLTWPEGNGWLARRLAERLDGAIQSGQMAFRITEESRGVALDVYEQATGRVLRWRTAQVVWAAPSFLLRHVWRDIPSTVAAGLGSFDYAPWLVANLSLRQTPLETAGAPLSWDNVLYDSPSLGYVVATHQDFRSVRRETVLTYYLPLSGLAPADGRRLLLERSWWDWADGVFYDLAPAHPELRDLTANIDLFRWGHGMIRPSPGFLFGGGRERVAEGSRRIHPAHSDLSGFSLFEEAQYRGILAAERALARI